MLKKIKILIMSLCLILNFYVSTTAIKENKKVENEQTTSLQTQKESFSECSKKICLAFQELNKGECLNWEMLNDIIILINLTHCETEYLEKLERIKNNIKPNKNLIILLKKYNRIFEEIVKKIEIYINKLEENLNNIKDYQYYSNFDFSFSDEDKKEDPEDEEKKLKEKENTIIIYRNILENVLNTLNFSYMSILKNLIELIEKTYNKSLKETPKTNNIELFENKIKINEENIKKLEQKINKIKTNLNQIITFKH